MIQQRTWQLLNILADGKFHSGERLAELLDVSRGSVFNALADLADCGIGLQRIRGRGYRLLHPWQRLEHGEILRWLDQDGGQFNIEIVPQATSSNTLLMQRSGSGAGDAPCGSVLAVELQTAGRGRMGRTWHSGLGNSLTFSLLWRFDCGLNALSGLSLAVGVAIVHALQHLGAQGVQLKWPNDILYAGGKLGGVLIEAQGDMLGPSVVVIGIGMNCFLPHHPAIDQPVRALHEVFRELPTRNRLLAAMLHELALVLRRFTQHGFGVLRDEWELCHAHQNQQIQLRMADNTVVNGEALGVSDSGELRLRTVQGIRHFNSGEVGRLR